MNINDKAQAVAALREQYGVAVQVKPFSWGTIPTTAPCVQSVAIYTP